MIIEAGGWALMGEGFPEPSDDDMFALVETGVPIFIGVVAVIMVLAILAVVVTGLRVWVRNNRSPVSVVDALVVAKRMHVTGGSGDSGAHTSYYATFQVQPGGERIELQVSGRDYGALAERDHGALTYQGTRYKGFDRRSQPGQ